MVFLTKFIYKIKELNDFQFPPKGLSFGYSNYLHLLYNYYIKSEYYSSTVTYKKINDMVKKKFKGIFN